MTGGTARRGGRRGRHGGRRAHGRLFNVTSEMGSICPAQRRREGKRESSGQDGTGGWGWGCAVEGESRGARGKRDGWEKQEGLHFPGSLEFSKAA